MDYYDNTLYELVLEALLTELWINGARPNFSKWSVAIRWNCHTNQALRVLGKLQADGWMQSYVDSGHLRQFRLRDGVMVEEAPAL